MSKIKEESGIVTAPQAEGQGSAQPARVIEKMSGIAYGYEAKTYVEEGEARDKCVVGTINGNLFVKPEGFGIDSDLAWELDFDEERSGYDREYIIIFTERKKSGRKWRKLFDEDKKAIYITQTFVDEIKHLIENYKYNKEHFGKRSVKEPFEIARDKIKILEKDIEDYKRACEKKNDEIWNLKRENGEMKQKLSKRDENEEIIEKIKRYVDEHPYSRGKAIKKAFL